MGGSFAFKFWGLRGLRGLRGSKTPQPKARKRARYYSTMS